MTTRNLALASPIDETSIAPVALYVRDLTTPYPDDYPYPKQSDCEAKVKTEENKSLFYTSQRYNGYTAKQLRDCKKQLGLHIVGDSFTYPAGFDNPAKSTGNLDNDDSYYARFIDEFSTVFAAKSSGEVFLLLNFDIDPNNPPAGHCASTWYRVEFDALKANSAVTKVTQVNPTDFTQTRQIWPQTGTRMFKRQGSNSTSDSSLCLDYEQGSAPNLVPPPTGDDDGSTTTPPAPAPSYAAGTCSFHVDEYQDCSDDSQNLFAVITMYDNSKTVIGQTDTSQDSIGAGINAGDPYSFTSKLPQPLIVTGEHEGDYIQFQYGSLQWTSRTTTGPATCSNGGWDPRDGPVCGLRFGDTNAVCISFLLPLSI